MSVEYTTAALGALVAALGYFYLRTNSGCDVHPMILEQQSTVSYVRHSGESSVYRSKQTPTDFPLLLTTSRLPFETVSAFWESEAEAALENAPLGKVFLHVKDHQLSTKGEPKFTNLTYRDFRTRLQTLVAGLSTVLGSRDSSSTDDAQVVGAGGPRKVAILLPNSSEWLLSYHAVLRLGLIAVPLSSQWSSEVLTSILRAMGIDTAIVPSTSSMAVILALRDSGTVHTVLTVANQPQVKTNGHTTPDPPTELVSEREASKTFAQVSDALAAKSIKVLKLEDLPRSDDAELATRIALPRPHDTAHILFTVDHAGRIKGAISTHAHLMTGAATIHSQFPVGQHLGSSDRYLNAAEFVDPMGLNLCHAVTLIGGSIIVDNYQTVEAISNDAYASRPTFLYLPATLFNSLYLALLDHIDRYATLERILCHKSLRRKMALVESGRLAYSTFWDLLYFRHFRQSLGGSVKALFTQGATAIHGAAKFVRATMSCQVFLTYGMLETSGLMTSTLFYDYIEPYGAHVGPPLPCCEIKLVNNASTRCQVTDEPNPRGEIHVRGNNVLKIVHIDEAGSAAVKVPTASSNGWLATGVMGEFMPNGTLRLLGDTTTYIELPAVERYVSLPRCENILRTSRLVNQICLIYSEEAAELVAVVYPHLFGLQHWAKSSRTNYALASIASNRPVIEAILDDLATVGAEHGLEAYEIPKKAILVSHPFNIENKMLKPDLSVDRIVIKAKCT
ncbi:medium-chain fatty acid-CoA ligase faa2 [Dimargaris xerosporica]|nr:medium-chain fatty acid-CoA ligase faa2 [Dimargaris xerosporica]